jgi:hypothetical protein
MHTSLARHPPWNIPFHADFGSWLNAAETSFAALMQQSLHSIVSVQSATNAFRAERRTARIAHE